MSFVCPKLATVYELYHIRYKSMGTIMKGFTLILSSTMRKITVKFSDKQSYL